MNGKNSFSFFRIIIIPLLAVSVLLNAQGFLHTQDKRIVDENGQEVLLRGFGLGGWLVPEGYMLHFPGFGSPTTIRNSIEDLIGPDLTGEFYERYRQNYVNEADIELIAEWGFNSVRLPFHYQLLTSLDRPTAFKQEGFQLLDSLITWCRNNQLYLILDLHCAPGGQNPGPISDSNGSAELWSNAGYQDLTVELWREIARRYAAEPVIAGYDLLNEPVLYGDYSNADLRNLYMRITAAIREYDQRHIVFIEGNWYATDFSSLSPPFDGNMVYAFHNYWSQSNLNSINQFLLLRENTQAPLWLGEFGENSNHWGQETIRIAEEWGIGWNWWTHKKLSTITSPLSVNISSDYWDLMDYFSGNGVRPSVETAFNILMEMADNLALDKCEFRPDVLHALTDSAGLAKPYARNVIPGNIPVQNYDMGLNGVAYGDNDFEKTHWDRDEPWNIGYTARNDGVDLENVPNQPGLVNIGWIENGEWINYTVYVERSGKYEILLETSANDDSGLLSFRLDRTDLLSNIPVPATGGNHFWTTYSAGEVDLVEGEHQLQLYFLRGGFNLKTIRVNMLSDSSFEKISNEMFIGNNYPNPFNTATSIPVILNTSQRIDAQVFNYQGMVIRTLHTGVLPNGLHHLKWSGLNDDGKQVSSGTYFIRVSIPGNEAVQKISLIH